MYGTLRRTFDIVSLSPFTIEDFTAAIAEISQDHVVRVHTILYYTILYYTILYNTMLYYTSRFSVKISN